MTPPAFTTLADIAAAAREALPHDVWSFIADGAGDSQTLARNRAAFERLSIWPRRFTAVGERSLATTVLGTPVSLPVLLAPTGPQRAVHPEGELASARAAAGAGTVMIVGEGSSTPIEAVQAAAGAAWFQAYFTGRASTSAICRRAETAGYTAICLTVDVPVRSLGKDNDRRNGFLISARMPTVNFAANGVEDALRAAVQPVLLEDLAWLARETALPLVVKGILRPGDARAAVEAGARGIIVSNHGGRVLDGVPASLEALPGVVAAVGDRAEVYLDGGVRRGTDILKALALGARAVCVGMPLWCALAAGGESGVRSMLEILRAELDHAMAFSGIARLAEAGPDLLAP